MAIFFPQGRSHIVDKLHSIVGFDIMTSIFREMLKHRIPLVLDGASGTLLEEKGIKPHPKLWASIALVDNPNAVKDMHLEYFAAGANIATTVTYQASVGAFEGILEPTKAFFTITQGVIEAKEAAAEAKSPLIRLVAGSIGPYGAFLAQGQEYTGEYGDATMQDLQKFHQPTISALVAGDADLLLFETIPSKIEIDAIVAQLTEQKISIPVIVSLSVKISADASEGPCVTLADGTSLDELNIPEWVDAVGANCFPVQHAEAVLDALKVFKRPLVLYPNSGEVYDGITSTWSRTPESVEAWDIDRWLSAGVSVIGGCCRTGPPAIMRISQAVERWRREHIETPV